MDNDRERQIRDRAYRLWEDEGRPEGRHEHHWTQASQEVGDELFGQQGAEDHERTGALDGGLLPAGGLVAGGGPSGAGVGSLGTAGESGDQQGQQQGSMTGGSDGGLSSGLQPGGTIPGQGSGVGMGSIGTGGGSTAGEATGTPGRQQE